jgi:two-component system response regulator MtrA
VQQPKVDPSASGAAAKIVIVDSDPVVAELLGRMLGAEGYQTRSVATGASARAMLASWRPEMAIVELMLPDEDGLVLCHSMKAQARVSILVCSATRRARDEFLSLKLGADDFIAKPFDIYHLAARVEALLRRHAAPLPPTATTAEPETLTLDELVINERGLTATLSGQSIPLTPIELRLLAALAQRAGEVVPRDRLAQMVWRQPTVGNSRTVDVHVGRLRAKLAKTSAAPPTITSIRGYGYKLTRAQANIDSTPVTSAGGLLQERTNAALA